MLTKCPTISVGSHVGIGDERIGRPLSGSHGRTVVRLSGGRFVKSLIISLHDVAPASAEASRRWMEQFDERGLSVSILVVPGPWRNGNLLADTPFIEWLSTTMNKSHEVVLHGWSHTIDHSDRPGIFRGLAGQFVARGCQEFWGLTETEAHVRLQKGLSTLAQLGYSPSGFIAPGWMTSPAAIRAVREIGFDYLTSHFHVQDLVVGTHHFAPVVCQRPGSWSSVAIAHATKYFAGFLRSVNLPLRVAVHPDDLHDFRLRNAILDVVDQAIADGYQSVTYETFISNSRFSHQVVPAHQLESFA